MTDRTFTPYASPDSGTRLAVKLSDADWSKIGRGGRWAAEVADLGSGLVLHVRDADCGAGCRCAAEVVKVATRDGVAVQSSAVTSLLSVWPEPSAEGPREGLFLEFMNAAPDTIASLRVESPEIGDHAVPDQAVSYAFYRYTADDIEFVGPHVFLSQDPVVATGEEMIAAGRTDRANVDFWASRGATSFGLVTWGPETNGSEGDMIVPLLGQVVLAERITGRQVWPETVGSEVCP
jgi:hypothetical protein